MALYDNNKYKEDIEKMKLMVKERKKYQEEVIEYKKLLEATRGNKEAVGTTLTKEEVNKLINERRKEIRYLTIEIGKIMNDLLRMAMERCKKGFKGSDDLKNSIIKDYEKLITLGKKRDELTLEIEKDTIILEELEDNREKGTSTITDNEFKSIVVLLEEKMSELIYCNKEMDRISRELKKKVGKNPLEEINEGKIIYETPGMKKLKELEEFLEKKAVIWNIVDKYMLMRGTRKFKWYEVHKLLLIIIRYQDQIKNKEKLLECYKQLEEEKKQMKVWEMLSEKEKIISNNLGEGIIEECMKGREKLIEEKEKIEIFLKANAMRYLIIGWIGFIIIGSIILYIL